MIVSSGSGYSAYLVFDREDWAQLRASTPLTLSEDELAALQGINEQVSLKDVAEVYLPLSRLLNLHFRSVRSLGGVRDEFLGRPVDPRPYVLGIAGSVAVGKSTFARTLQAVLARWPDHPSVALVTTDGFLYPNAELEARGLLRRKGFPESYDTRELVRFVGAVKSGAPEVRAPVYSHLTYDIIPDEHIVVRQPDVLIVEGLNVLQTGTDEDRRVFVSDYFDFSVYVDADESDIKRWYIERFRRLRDTAFRDPRSYFQRFADLTDAEADEVAFGIWQEINGRNLEQNVLPTRSRADLILHKGPNHAVEAVHLRKL
jgi:type I pantothenate kinase